MAALNPLSHAFGLDIGDRSFKIAQIQHTRSAKDPYRLTAWGEVEVPEGIMSSGDINDMGVAVSHLQRLFRESSGRLKGRGVIACLPEAKTFIKIIYAEGEMSDDDLRKAVLREIEQNIPLPADEIYYDWQVLDRNNGQEKEEPLLVKTEGAAPDAKAEKDEKEAQEAEVKEEPAKPQTVRVLLGAAPKRLVDGYTTMLENAGLAPIALEIEATAISRAIIPALAAPDDAVGILDIGATRSSLVIYDNGIIQMSISIPISGIAITKAISDALGVTMTDAEILKKECGLDATRCEDKMWRILLPLIDDMTDKIRNALRFYKVGFPQGRKIESLYLCGGGAHFREIDTVLSRKLTIKAVKGDALTNLHDSLPRSFPKDRALSYATAIGLGIRAADENRRNRNKFY